MTGLSLPTNAGGQTKKGNTYAINSSSPYSRGEHKDSWIIQRAHVGICDQQREWSTCFSPRMTRATYHRNTSIQGNLLENESIKIYDNFIFRFPLQYASQYTRNIRTEMTTRRRDS